MAHKFITLAVLLAVLVQLSHTHPLTLYRITRHLDSVGHPEDDAEILLAELTDESGQATAAELIQVPRSLVEQPNAILIDVAYPGADEDLFLSETQIFRPLFTYRQQVARRQRVKKVVDQK